MAILGLRSCIQLRLVQINSSLTTGDANKPIESIEDLAKEYSGRFLGIGSFPGKPKILLIENVTPVIQPSK